MELYQWIRDLAQRPDLLPLLEEIFEADQRRLSDPSGKTILKLNIFESRGPGHTNTPTFQQLTADDVIAVRHDLKHHEQEFLDLISTW